MIHWSELHMVFDKDGNPTSGEIVYSHVDSEEGVVRHFAVERIVKDLQRGALTPEIIEFHIDPAFAAYARIHRGVEAHRLYRITPVDLAHFPVVMAEFPGIGRDAPDQLLIDGHHRYVRAWMMGWKTLRAYTLPRDVWERYLVYIPTEFLPTYKDDLLNQGRKPIDSRIK